MKATTSPENASNIHYFQRPDAIASMDVDTLLEKLARGHLSTFQEEYAELKRMLRPRNATLSAMA